MLDSLLWTFLACYCISFTFRMHHELFLQEYFVTVTEFALNGPVLEADDENLVCLLLFLSQWSFAVTAHTGPLWLPD